MAERRGFEPRNQLPSYYLSKQYRSTTDIICSPALPHIEYGFVGSLGFSITNIIQVVSKFVSNRVCVYLFVSCCLRVQVFKYNVSLSVRWESGLIRLLGKQVCQQWHPEFESRSHRQIQLIVIEPPIPE